MGSLRVPKGGGEEASNRIGSDRIESKFFLPANLSRNNSANRISIVSRADREKMKKEEEKKLFWSKHEILGSERIGFETPKASKKCFYFLSETIFPGTRSNLRVCINLAAVSR